MDNQKRRNYFIDKNFQSRFILRFCLIVMASSLLIGVLLFYLSGNFTTVMIEDTHVVVKRTSDFMLPIIIVVLPLVTLMAALSVIILTLFTSHRIAGPLFRLCKEIEAFKNGNWSAVFRTRRTDQLQALTQSLSEMGDCLGAQCADVKKKFVELQKALRDPAADKAAIERTVAELETLLNYFKI